MSNTKHTPEPWKHAEPSLAGWVEILNNEYDTIGSMYMKTPNENEANAARIVACVNACAGKPNPIRWVKEADEMLTKVIAFEHPEMKLGDSRLDTLLKFAAQRDELLKALEYIVANEHPKSDAYQVADDAIAKAKGGQK